MIKTDCHMHTSISSDSDTPMDEMVRASIDAGLDTITFTEHMDWEFPEIYDLNFRFEPDEYFAETDRARKIYGGKITILNGIELGLKYDLKTSYDYLLDKYGWDFVIGSTHLVDGIDPYYSDYWCKASEYDCIKRYFECVYENIKSFNNFDSLGHLDYILRYTPTKPSVYSYNDFKEIIDSILHFIIKKDIALEVNSSGYESTGNPNPSRSIIERYVNLGGKLITIGSDAHSAKYVGYKYDELSELLRAAGLKEYAVFKNRTPIMRRIF